MNNKGLSKEQLSVFKALENNKLTTLELLQKVKGIANILDIYKTINELNRLGLVKTFKDQNIKIHTLN